VWKEVTTTTIETGVGASGFGEGKAKWKFGNSSVFVAQNVATLALGSWPMQGLTKVEAKYEAWESHFMFPGMQESVREWMITYKRST
jgi:hypothetical protein